LRLDYANIVGAPAMPGEKQEGRICVLNVLVTMPFTEEQLKPLRNVSPEVRVTREDAERADYSRTDVLYAGSPPRDLARAPRLRWVQVHVSGFLPSYDDKCAALFAENLRRYLAGVPLLNLVDRATGY
jgi:phosphoglycerate dehydrogenase-like enzyme